DLGRIETGSGFAEDADCVDSVCDGGCKMKISEQTREALQRAADWRLLSLLLERPRPGWQEEIGMFADQVETDIRPLVTLAREATEEAYIALFGPGGPVSPREASYGGFADPGAVLADVTAFYEAFHYFPKSENPVDHISVQTGFLGYLSLKEAYALESGNTDALEATRSSLNHFLEAHYATLVRGFAT